MSYNSTVYNEQYYKSHCGNDYERGNGWEEIFARQAARIVKELKPKKILDVGCASGYLVEGLRDLGVDARGIDVSEYAISKVREDIKPYCNVQSATVPIKERYDLITCIEVMEHLSPEDFNRAIDNMCNATNTIIFSSTPFDYAEETHFSVNTPGFWAERFAYNGFFHDVNYDCSYIAVQTMLFRKREYNDISLVRTYEDKLFDLWYENCAMRDRLNLANARIQDLDHGNIQHAVEVNKYIEQINAFEEERKNWYSEFEKNKEEEIRGLCEKHQQQIKDELSRRDELKEKYHIALAGEYNKRDVLEQKYRIAENQRIFLESELYRYKVMSQEYLEKYSVINSAVNKYKQSRLVKISIVLSKRIESIEKKVGKHSVRRLLKKDMRYWNPVFDAESYCKYNQDIYSAYGEDKKNLLKHFIINGMSEGRRAKDSFDVEAYAKYNPDIKDMYGDDIRQLYLHYIEKGIKENRRTC